MRVPGAVASLWRHARFAAPTPPGLGVNPRQMDEWIVETRRIDGYIDGWMDRYIIS